MCAQTQLNYFRAIIHEFGHIHYFMEYKDLHVTYQDAPNPAFHEAVKICFENLSSKLK